MNRVAVVWRFPLQVYEARCCTCGAVQLRLKLSEAEQWATTHECEEP